MCCYGNSNGENENSTDKLHPVVIATIVVKMIKAGVERMYCSISPLEVNSVRKDSENWFWTKVKSLWCHKLLVPLHVDRYLSFLIIFQLCFIALDHNDGMKEDKCNNSMKSL